MTVVNPSGPHRRDRCRTSLNASNTGSREGTDDLGDHDLAITVADGALPVPSGSSAASPPDLLQVLHIRRRGGTSTMDLPGVGCAYAHSDE